MVTAVGFPVKDLKEERPASWEEFAAATRCSRCNGLMVNEPCIDFPVRRCVQCGEIIDPVILRNRQYRDRDAVGSNHY